MKKRIKRFLDWLFLSPGFYELQVEWDILKDEKPSGRKYFKMAHLFKRYSNGYAICMTYGPLDEQKYNNFLANLYSKLSEEYRELGIKMLQQEQQEQQENKI